MTILTKFLTLALPIIYLNSCCQKPEKQDASYTTEDSTISTTVLAKECVQKDTTTQLGTQIHYIYQNGKFQISWGDKTYKRTYDSSFTCYVDSLTGIWNLVPKYYAETQNHLVFRSILWTSGGANPAPLEYAAIIFPKNLNDSICEKEFLIDKIEGYLIYGDPLDGIQVLNIDTKKIQTIFLRPLPIVSRAPTSSIIDIKINKNKIWIKYEGCTEDNNGIVENSITLRI